MNFKFLIALVSVLVLFAGCAVMADVSEDSDAATYTVQQGGSFQASVTNGNNYSLVALTGTVSESNVMQSASYENNVYTVHIKSTAPTGTYTLIFTGMPEQVVLDNHTVVITAASSGEPTINFTSPSAVDGISGSTITYTATTNVSGSVFSTATVSGKPNASWLSLSGATLSGTAPSVSSVTTAYYNIKAVSPGGQQAIQTVSFTIYPVAQIVSPSYTSVSGTIGSAITSINLEGNLPMTWGKTGSFPAGITMSGSVISGTPTESGTFTVSLKGYTTSGPSQTASKTLTFNISEQTLTITSTPPSGVVMTGTNYSYTPSASIAGVTWSIINGPEWLVVSNGTVTGTVPTTIISDTTVSYTIKARSAGGQEVTQSCTIMIEPTLEFTSVPTAACVVIPVYDYGSDGIPFLSGLFGSMVDAADGDNIAITETGTRTFKFVWTGENATRVTWDFGDGETAEGFVVTHTYAENGIYEYVCTGHNELGSSEVRGTINVNMSESGIPIYVLIGLAALILFVFLVRRSGRRVHGRSRGGRR